MYDPPRLDSLPPAEDDDPAVPVEPELPALLPSCRQPVTVIVLPVPLLPLLFPLFPLCVLPLCAAVPTTQPVAIAIAVAVHVERLIGCLRAPVVQAGHHCRNPA